MNRKANYLKRTRLSDQVIHQIISRISKGELKVGDKISPEKILAEYFGVGRSTVREAMHTLSVMGIIDVRPGRGAHIVDIPSTTLELPLRWNSLKEYPKAEKLVEARVILEQGLVELAIKNANYDDVAKLEIILSELESVQADREKFIELDLSFHTALAKASHNELLVRFYNELCLPLRIWFERQTAYFSDESVQHSIHRHRLILQSIKDKKTNKAKQMIRRHIHKD
jgi:GntR family transcriptional repressor for pyruvate dehydrogenase complex